MEENLWDRIGTMRCSEILDIEIYLESIYIFSFGRMSFILLGMHQMKSRREYTKILYARSLYSQKYEINIVRIREKYTNHKDEDIKNGTDVGGQWNI